jgi:hypothetical protein
MMIFLFFFAKGYFPMIHDFPMKKPPYLYWLVVSTHLKNISQLGRIIPYIMENKCSKPPTSTG